MTLPVAQAVDWGAPPAGLDQIAADLRAMRAAAGDPSYTQIGHRVMRLRAARGVPEHERRLPRTTLYNCFRDGRRRLDAALVMDVALALGLPGTMRQQWATRLRVARAAEDGADVATARDDVPVPVAHFTGREAELAVLERLVGEAGQAWLSATSGEGKTQLILRLGQRLASAGTGVLFLDLRGYRAESAPVAPSAALRAILRYFGAQEDGPTQARRRRALALLADSGRVLLLDDAKDGQQVVAIIGAEPGVPVVVTSRTPLPERGGEPSGWTHLPVGGLGVAETAALLRTFAPASTSVDVADPATGRLATVTGGSPLAIALVGGRLASHPQWTLDEHVDLITQRLASGHVEESLRLELDLSYRELPSDAARLLRAFADLPVAELDLPGAAVLLDEPFTAANRAICDLVEVSLAVRRDERIALHSLVRAYGRVRAEEADPPRLRREAFARFGTFLAERVWAAYATIARSMQDAPRHSTFTYPRLQWTADEAGRWLREHLGSLLTMAHHAPQWGTPEVLFRISEGLSWWLNLVGHHTDALRLHEAAADLAADVGEPDALAMASLDAGQLLLHSDRPHEAQVHFERATGLVANAGRLSDPGVIGVIANMSALIDLRRGRTVAAQAGLRRAVEVHADRGEDARLMSALVNLGLVLHTIGDFDGQREVLERGARVAAATGHDLFDIYFRVNHAQLALETGHLDEALRTAEESIRRAHDLNTPYLAVSGATTAAEVLRRRGDLAAAQQRAEEALNRARTIGAGSTMVEVLLMAAAIAADMNHVEATRDYLAEAEPLLAPGGDHLLRARLWELRAELCLDVTGRRDLLQKALKEFEQAGSFRAAELRATLATTV